MSKGRKRREEENGVEREKRAKLQDTRSILLSAQYVSFMTTGREREREGGERKEIERETIIYRALGIRRTKALHNDSNVK